MPSAAVGRRAGLSATLVAITTLWLTACASNPYQYGTGRTTTDAAHSPTMDRQIVIGRPNALLDASDWIWPGSLLSKLLLWNADIDSHQIDPQTIADLNAYLAANDLSNVQVLVNAYSPGNQWSRLFNNKTVGAGWRYTLGLVSVTLYTLLPGRFFGGDAYNPYTNTIYLYSNDTSVALHEGGHAKDFGRRELKGTHAAIYSLPLAPLYYEARASNDALGYLRCQQQNAAQQDAYKTLYPAYTTYISGGLTQVYAGPFWTLLVIPGHMAGQVAAGNVEAPATYDGTVEGCAAPLYLPPPTADADPADRH